MSLLVLQKVCKTFHNESAVLEQINLILAPGQVGAVVGVSGSGKSTLLHIAALLENADSGTIVLNGKDVGNCSDLQKTLLRREHIGFVYQFHNLLPEFTVLENLLIPQFINHKGKKEAVATALDLLEEIGMQSEASREVNELSGGEQQRIAVLRSLVNKPHLLLADEPTGNLDEHNAAIVLDLFIKETKKRDSAALIVTHNTKLASKADIVFALSKGELTVIEI